MFDESFGNLWKSEYLLGNSLDDLLGNICKIRFSHSLRNCFGNCVVNFLGKLSDFSLKNTFGDAYFDSFGNSFENFVGSYYWNSLGIHILIVSLEIRSVFSMRIFISFLVFFDNLILNFSSIFFGVSFDYCIDLQSILKMRSAVPAELLSDIFLGILVTIQLKTPISNWFE